MSTINYSEEGSVFNWEYYWDRGSTNPPSAPMLRSRSVASAADMSAANDPATVSGTEEVLPEHLLFMPGHLYFARELDPRLNYTETRRPVLEPLRFRILNGEYLRWGAAIVASEDGDGIELGAVEDTEKRVAPATNPPIAKLWIATEDGAVIEIKPRPGMSFVAVADVQEAVIRWMEEMYEEIETGVLAPSDSRYHELLSSRWMWRGLLQVGQGLDVWELQC